MKSFLLEPRLKAKYHCLGDKITFKKCQSVKTFNNAESPATAGMNYNKMSILTVSCWISYETRSVLHLKYITVMQFTLPLLQ